MILDGKKVFIYRNLHKNIYSVRSDGRVIAHVKDLILKDVKYCVGKKGREKVLETRQKNVHAGLRGVVVSNFSFLPSILSNSSKVTYNPYTYETFVRKEDDSPILRWKTRDVCN